MTNVNPGNDGRHPHRGSHDDLYADHADHAGHAGDARDIHDAEYIDADYPDGVDDADTEYTEYADPDAEHVEYGEAEYEEYPEEGYHEEGYRGAHRIRSEEPEAGEAAAVAGGSTAAAAGGLPKRGLGMILIAVGAILLLWGIYALTQRDADTQNSVAAPTASQSATPGTAPGSAQPAPGAQPSQAAPSGQPTPSGQPGQPAPTAPAAQPGQPAQPGQLTRENAEVSVYNNSPTPDLAGTTAQKLASDYKVTNTSANAAQMNLPEQTYGIFPQTYVFYDPSVAGAEQVAADVAQRVGGAPRSVRDLPQGASLPREVAGNRNAVTVVLAG